jgi:hypothetical protein
MKQSEKLDLILSFLYEKKFDGFYYGLPSILSDHGIEVNFDEGFALGKRLERDGLVDAIADKSGVSVTLTTHGVDYIENDSYTYKGHSIITNNYNISVTDSTNTSIVKDSLNTTVNQSAKQVDSIINEIITNLRKEKIDEKQLQEIKDCLAEIKIATVNNIKPKFAFRSLVTMTSEFSSIGSLILSLGQLIGQH